NYAWAVGKAQFQAFSRHSLIEHWNGSAWSLLDGPTSSGSVLYSLVAASPATVWAAGNKRRTRPCVTRVARWHGPAWPPAASPNAGNGDSPLTAVVAPAGTGEVWASGGSADGTLALHYTP